MQATCLQPPSSPDPTAVPACSGPCPRLAGRLDSSAGWGWACPLTGAPPMTEIHSELQLVALSFSGAPVN